MLVKCALRVRHLFNAIHPTSLAVQGSLLLKLQVVSVRLSELANQDQCWPCHCLSTWAPATEEIVLHSGHESMAAKYVHPGMAFAKECIN